MILLPINKNIVKTLQDCQITSDYIGSALIVLLCLYHKNYTLLDSLDKENADKLFLEVYKDLEIKGILTKSKSEIHFELTDLGALLVQTIIKEQKKEVITDNKSVDLGWVREWIDLWKSPEYKRFYRAPDEHGGRGRTLGASEKDIETRFTAFFNSYAHIFGTREPSKIIMAATAEYIAEEREKNFAFTKNAMNFIMKQEGSTKDTKASMLAMKCEEYMEGDVHNLRKPSLLERSIN